MGKRELLLIAVFVILGVVTWQVTRPPSEPGAEGFSFGQALDRVRTAMRGERAPGDVRAAASATPATGVTTVALADFAGDVTIVGETRSDVSAELTGSVFGVDSNEAAARAKTVALGLRPETERMAVTLKLPDSRRRPRLELRVRVPRQLGVSLRNVRGRIEVRDVASAELDTRSGEVTLADVAGVVKGQHRGGQIEVSRVGGCAFESRMGDVRVSQVNGTLTWTADGGRIEIRDVAGAATLKVRRADLDMERPGAEVSIEAEDGQVEIREQRHKIEYEGRRARLTVTLASPVAGDITVEDGSVDLALPGGPQSLDLEADDGRIRVPDDLPKVTVEENRQSLKMTAGPTAPLIVVRTQRDGITVTRR